MIACARIISDTADLLGFFQTTAAADHTGEETRNWGYNSTQNVTIEDLKMLPGLMSLNFCCNTQMIRSELVLNNMKAWLYSASYLRVWVEMA